MNLGGWSHDPCDSFILNEHANGSVIMVPSRFIDPGSLDSESVTLWLTGLSYYSGLRLSGRSLRGLSFWGLSSFTGRTSDGFSCSVHSRRMP